MDGLSFPEEPMMHRFYAEPSSVRGSLAALSREDARHAVTVLRLKPGQHVEIFLEGMRHEAEIVSADSSGVTVRLLSFLPSTEPTLSITLYQGLPKSDRMDLIVQKSTELGVTRIIPVLMSRCVVRPDPKDLDKKAERWKKIAREAGKQSGRCFIPEIADPVPLDQLAVIPGLPDTNIVPWEEASGFGPLAFHQNHPSLSSLGVLIGPEGGIESDEIVFLRSLGFTPITLGKRILRTETAGPAVLSSFMCLYGEME